MTGPLRDLTVLDLTQYVTGPYATRLLADYGADVIKVERPGGDPSRRLGPYPGGTSHPEKSGTFFYFNLNKRSIVLDLRSPVGLETFGRLVDRADVVVESFRPGALDSLGVGWDYIHRRKPSLPLVSISSFGQTGPYRDYKGSELVLFGYAGEMYATGLAGREPLKMYGTAALVQAGAATAGAILAAAMAGREQGIGQHVDFAIAEAQLASADRRHSTLIGYEFARRKTVRRASEAIGLADGVFPCSDGYMELHGAARWFDRLQDMLGRPEWALDARWTRPGAAQDPAIIEEFNGHLQGWLMERTKREVWREARRARVLCAPLLTIAEIFEDEGLQERGFWQDVEHPFLGTVRVPGRPFVMPASPWEIRRPAPLLGEHTEEIVAELAVIRPSTGSSRGVARKEGTAHRPLAGLRVIDFCVAWAGPYATMLLGDLGAEVIKVENPHVWPPVMRGGRARPTKEQLAGMGGMYGGYPNGEPGPRPWNYSPTFVQPYRNKKSCTVDIRTREGLEILRKLVARADVFIENNAADTIEKLGVDYDWLKAANPDIIMVRIPAFGLSGPYAHARALGVHLEAVMGHSLLRGYRDMDPSSNSIIFAGDYFGGLQAALATLMAVWHKKKAGQGQLVEVSQAEAASAMFAQAYMDYAINGAVHGALGNRSIYGAAPCGVYPCKSPGAASTGDDRWIAITVTSDDEWQALRRVMGDPPWASDPGLDSAAGRAANQDLLDRALAEWTVPQDDYALFHRLQAAGVPAAPVLEASRALADPHFDARGAFARARMFDNVGEFRFLAPFYHFPQTPIALEQAPVAMGEHNEYVYRALLGVSEEEYRRLIAAGHISMDFDESIP